MTATITASSRLRERPMLSIAMMLLIVAGLTPIYHAVSSTGSLYRYMFINNQSEPLSLIHSVSAAVWGIALLGVLLSIILKDRKLVRISALSCIATLALFAIVLLELSSAGMKVSMDPAFFLLPVAAVCSFVGYRQYR